MSNEYTPTTAEVREVWADQTGIASRRPMHREEFDRWITGEIKKAVDVGYLAALRMAAYEATNYTGHPYNAAATLALGFTLAADKIEEEED